MSHAPGFLLKTPRLILRALALSDLDALVTLYSEEGLNYFVPGLDISTATREELRWILDVYYTKYGFGLWATLDKVTGDFIGRCGLIPWTLDTKQEVEVAYHITKDYRQKGLATEAASVIRDYAFRELNLPRLVSFIDPDNLSSIRVAEKLGMQLEKTLGSFIHEDKPTLVYTLENTHKP